MKTLSKFPLHENWLKNLIFDKTQARIELKENLIVFHKFRHT